MADLGLLRGLHVLSTVSGGSIVGALYYLHVQALLETVPDADVEHHHYRTIVASVEQMYRAAAGRNLRGRALLDYAQDFKLASRSFSRTDRIAELYDKWFFRPIKWDGEKFSHATGDRRLTMTDLLIRPRRADGTQPKTFKPKHENECRSAPVPSLIINATSLNTGHNWRFEAEYIGERTFADPSHVKVDRNVRLTSVRYDELPAGDNEYHLGTAVASSAAFPGGLAPKALEGLFEGFVVELSDGGVNDNQGVDGLLDEQCTRLIVSDAAAQMPAVPKPAVRIPSVVERVGAIARRTSREQRMLYASERVGEAHVDFMHLQTGLRVPLLPPIGTGEETSLDPHESSGIPADVQRLLARMRTDLDAFSDIEASSMMLAGYRIAQRTLTPPEAGVPSYGEDDWRFASVAERMDAGSGAYLRRLWVSRLRFFKPLVLPVAPGPPSAARSAMRWGLLAGGAAGLAAGVLLLGRALVGSSVSAAAVYGVVVGLLAVGFLYLKSDIPILRAVSRMLYDTIVPLALALLGLFSIVSLGFVFEGWLHRGLGDEAGVKAWAGEVATSLLSRWVPAMLLVAGVAVSGLAVVVLVGDQWINVAGSLDELLLAPSLESVIFGGLALALAAILLELAGHRGSDCKRAIAVGLGFALTGAGLVGSVLLASAVLAALGNRGGAPESLAAAYVTFIGIAVAAGAIAFAAMTVSLRLIGRVGRAESETLPLGAVSVALVLVALFVGVRNTAKTDQKLRARDPQGLAAEAEHPDPRGLSPEEERTAMAYRPSLFFDSAERRPPLDVDALIGEAAMELCDPDCKLVRDGLALATDADNSDAVLQVRANPGAPSEFSRSTPQRIYFHLTYDKQRNLRYFDYWVYYRFNDSPKLNGLTCLPGLAISEATCFDHESDWEGVTVAVPGLRDAPRPAYVAYAGHKWRFRFSWDQLVAAGATSGLTHAKVWVARGSHASYPAPCGAGRSCAQLGSDVPDGRRDGRQPWRYNMDRECQREHCVARLPLSRAGTPASWAAFGGAWGMPRCTVGFKLCVRAQGPVSPYRQDRYARPGIAVSIPLR
jgi:hypothetical protein